jgi:Intracellular proteinase inhibitor
MPVLRALILAAALLAAACTPVPPPAAGGAAPRPGAAEEPLVSSLSVETAGDTVRLTLQVTNATAGPLTLRFTSGQTYDFAVDRGGESLWRWSASQTFMQALRDETLAAGETRAWSEAWVPGAPVRGELTARAWLTSSSHPVERATAFRLP